MFDAYTIKKIIPRLFIAVILVNLSWVISTTLLDASNVLGLSVLEILNGAFSGLTTDIFAGLGGGGTSILAALGLAGGIAIFFSSWMIILPALVAGALGLFLGYMVLIIRQVVIVGLIIVGPIAIALWVIPGTEGLAKKWWSIYIKVLLMYPVIILLLASGAIAGGLINETRDLGSDSIESAILFAAALIATFAPYFLIPLTFRFVGGAIATIGGFVNDRSKGIVDRTKKFSGQRASDGWDRKVTPRVLQKRADYAGKLQSKASRSGRFGGVAMRFGARTVGGYNVEAAMSARNAQEAKILNDQIATGRDDDIRGLTVNKKAADSDPMRLTKEANGDLLSANGLKKIEADGTVKYKSLGGQWIEEANVIEGHRKWGNNQFAQQAALSYEMRKAMTDEQVQGISDRYADLAMDDWGLSERQAGGNWIGAAFENQNQHLEYKNTDVSYKKGQRGAKINSKKLADEMYEKKGSYPIAQMSGHTITQLGKAYDEAEASGDTATMEKIKAVSETFVQRGVTGGQMVGDGDQQHIEGVAQATDGTPRTYSSGAAAVNEKVNWLARKTGALGPPPTAPPSGPGSPTPPPGSPQ